MSADTSTSTPKRSMRPSSSVSPSTVVHSRATSGKRSTVKPPYSEQFEDSNQFREFPSFEIQVNSEDYVEDEPADLSFEDDATASRVPASHVQASHSCDDGVEDSDAPLEGQKTMLRLGYTHYPPNAEVVTGIRMELVILDPLKHVDFNGLKAFCNAKGQSFMKPPPPQHDGVEFRVFKPKPVLVQEINGYADKANGTVVIFGKISCLPDLNFLKMLFKAVAAKSDLTFCPETYSSDEMLMELCSPFFAAGELLRA